MMEPLETNRSRPEPMLTPDPWATTRLGRFARRAAPGCVGNYPALWRWSVDDISRFWDQVWDEFDIHSSTPRGPALEDPTMPGATWYRTARVNYARQVLDAPAPDAQVAIIEEGETRPPREMSWSELRAQVSLCSRGLESLGVTAGDRVVGYLPNATEAVVAFLAVASLGATWSSCPLEFGVSAVVDRWTQIRPKVLITASGYRYRGRVVDRVEAVEHIRSRLPDLEAVVHVRYHDDGALPDSTSWEDLLSAAPDRNRLVDVPFDHPLYVLYSSGTTGLPKPIVHGHGGILLEHAKSLGLHLDISVGDRFFWYSTTGWMMWNYLVSGLLLGATIVLYDGHPAHPDPTLLWRMAERHRLTHVGLSSPFVTACTKQGLPGPDIDLSSVRTVGATGAPLPIEAHRWLAERLGPTAQVVPSSGGTDVCSAFVGGAPVLTPRPGRIPCRALGCDVHAYDEGGQPVVGTTGELVITQPMPSMPVGFWGDSGHQRYAATYFDAYPGVWRHGDWITFFEDGTCEISGRSDSTLNRGGVRFGTAELYSVVEALPVVSDSLAVHLEDPAGGLGELLLFVVFDGGGDGDRTQLVARAIRSELSPRHVPDEIIPVASLPRTLSGKKLEVPIKRILQGAPVDQAVSLDALEVGATLQPILDQMARRGPSPR